MNCKEVSDAIEQTFQKLSFLKPDEFKKIMEEHKTGDIAKILIETGAFDIYDR